MRLKGLLSEIVQGKKTISESSFEHHTTNIIIDAINQDSGRIRFHQGHCHIIMMALFLSCN